MRTDFLAKHKKIEDQERCENGQLRVMPTGFDFSTFLLSGLPVTADSCSGSPRIGANQISRPHGSIEVSGFWQMLSLISACENARMATGCSCRPTGYLFSTLNKQGQVPAGVNSSDSSDWNPVASENVLDQDFGFAHLNAGKPKEHKTQVADQQHQRGAQQYSRDAIGRMDADQGQGHGKDNHNRERSGGFGNEYLHPIIVAVKRRVCA